MYASFLESRNNSVQQHTPTGEETQRKTGAQIATLALKPGRSNLNRRRHRGHLARRKDIVFVFFTVIGTNLFSIIPSLFSLTFFRHAQTSVPSLFVCRQKEAPGHASVYNHVLFLIQHLIHTHTHHFVSHQRHCVFREGGERKRTSTVVQ